MLHYFIPSIVGVLSEYIVYQFDASQQEYNDWGRIGENGFLDCDLLSIMSFAKPQSWSGAMRNIYLPPHYMIYIELTFYRIDFWDTAEFIVYIDDFTSIYKKTLTSTGGVDICGDSDNDEIISIYQSAGHSSNFISIYVEVQNLNTHNSVWGFRDFKISIEPCPIGCVYCEQGWEWWQCKQLTLSYWDQTYNHIEYYNGIGNGLLPMKNCNSYCQYLIPLPQHTKVIIRFRVYVNEIKTVTVKVDSEITSHNTYGTLNIFQFYTFIIHSIHTNSNALILIYQTQGSLSLYIQDLQVFTLQDDYQMRPLTSVYRNNCESGWILDLQFFLCLPICGDRLIVGFEECDDGNNIENDGCYECKFSCALYCTSCLFGICQSCSNGYYLDSNKNCKPICGDGILVPYLEQCDQNDTNYLDLCSNCIITCSDNCIYCNTALCLKCQIGFQLKQGWCYPVCGDQIIINEFEDCDDGNVIPYDGCFDCKYQCRRDCQFCDKGNCLDECPNGQVMLNHTCQSLCGNSIVTKDEECDDGNSIQYDGCYQCFYSCPLFCSYCEAGKCLECIVNYKLSNNACSNLEMCGDGEIGDQEECDDGNLFPNDGCYNCQVEVDWICNSVIPSECAFQQAPMMVISYLNQTFSIQYVEITFSQQIKITSSVPLSLSIQISVIALSEEHYNITIYPIKQAKFLLSNAKYLISIEINQIMEEKPKLQIDLNQEVTNLNDISVTNQVESIILNKPKYLTPIQKQTTQSVLSYNQNVMIGLGIISVISLVMGEASIFQEIINILQYIAYLKFINLNIPENLSIFFQISDMVSIAPLLKYIQLDKQINILTFKEEATFPQGKFLFYQIDADLITNLACQFIQCLALVTAILCIKIFQQLLFKTLFISKYFSLMNLLASKTSYIAVFVMNQKLYQKIKTILNTTSVWALVGLRDLLLVNSWDLLFKTFLFLSSKQVSNIRDYIQILLSILIIISYHAIILFCFTKKTIFGSIGRLEQNQIYYETITLGRQILFLALLVFIQDDSVMQTLLINGINLGYFVILSVNNNLKLHTNFIQKLTEGSILLFTMSSIVYFDNFKYNVNEEHKIFFGFFHIAILSFALVVQVIKYVIIKGEVLFSYISQKIKEKPQTSINPIQN